MFCNHWLSAGYELGFIFVISGLDGCLCNRASDEVGDMKYLHTLIDMLWDRWLLVGKTLLISLLKPLKAILYNLVRCEYTLRHEGHSDQTVWGHKKVAVVIVHVVASELKDPIWHSLEWQI